MQAYQEPLHGTQEQAAPADTSSNEAGGFLISVEVKPCPDDPAKGQGVFALEAVTAGTAVWRPGLVRKLNPQQVAEQLAQLPADEAHVFLRQAFVTSEDPDHLCVNPTDMGRFMNHSRDPNCLAGYSGGTALRDIGAGEELTCDYGVLACPGWYQQLCDGYGVVSTGEVVRRCGGGSTQCCARVLLECRSTA